MNAEKKYAYRKLLYNFVNSLRFLRGPGHYRELEVLKGHEAYMLHNLADYSADDFVGFEEEMFWDDVAETFDSRHFDGYLKSFNVEIERYRDKQKADIRSRTIYPQCQWCKAELRKDGPCPDCGRGVGENGK